MVIASQQAAGAKAAGTSGDIRTGESYTSDQYSQVEVGSAAQSGGQWIGPMVRAQNSGKNAYVGLYFWNYGSPELMVFKRSNGAWTQLGAAYNSGKLAAGTQLKLMVVGSTITFQQNGVTRVTVTDTSLSGGAPGIMAYGTGSVDNWSGGTAGSGGTTYTVGGTVSGLSGTVVLQDNGGDNLTVTASGSFTFATALAGGAAYAVTVKTNPSGQTCTVASGSGAIGSANVTNVAVTCANNATYTVGGTVSGLSGTVVLQDNGGDNLTVAASGSFTFATALAGGAAYSVTVKTNPSGQACTVASGSGAIGSANVTNVAVTCAASSATGSDDFNRANGSLGAGWTNVSDGGMVIASQQAAGSAAAGTSGDIRTGESYTSDQYSQVEVGSAALSGGQWIGPMVRAQNSGQSAYVGLYFWNYGSPELMVFKRSGGAWTQLGAAYNSGTLTAGTQLKLMVVGSTITFQQNGVTRVTVTDTSLSGGAPGIMAYGTGSVDNWSGGTATGGGGGGTTYTVGGAVSGLSGTVVLQDNGGDDLSVTANGSFTFATALAGGAAFAVTVKTNPSGQTCTVANGSGTIGSANITNVAITCGGGSSGGGAGLQVQSTGTDANGFDSYQVTSADDGPGPQTMRVLRPTNPAPGVPHNFLFVLPVEPGLGDNFGDALAILQSLDAQDQYNLTIIEPTFAIDPWYADNPIDPNTQYETFMTKDLVPWVDKNLATTGSEQNWLIGFSKSGIGGQDLILKHPDIFAVAASWDFPADMSSYDYFSGDSAAGYGTDANFQANYRLTPSFVDAHKAPFLSNNRIWIGGYSLYGSDMSDYDALLTSEGIPHTTETPTPTSHRWDAGWLPAALAALHQDSMNLPSASGNAPSGATNNPAGVVSGIRL